MYRDPNRRHDVPKPPSNRAERRRNRALNISADKSDVSYTTLVLLLGIPTACGLLLILLVPVVPAIKEFGPAIWILSIVFALLLIASKQTIFTAWRETQRGVHRAERAQLRHEEKIAQADRKLGDKEYTIGADGEIVFGEKKKDQSSTTED